jgi:hypothetical protein
MSTFVDRSPHQVTCSEQRLELVVLHRRQWKRHRVNRVHAQLLHRRRCEGRATARAACASLSACLTNCSSDSSGSGLSLASMIESTCGSEGDRRARVKVRSRACVYGSISNSSLTMVWSSVWSSVSCQSSPVRIFSSRNAREPRAFLFASASPCSFLLALARWAFFDLASATLAARGLTVASSLLRTNAHSGRQRPSRHTGD